MGAAELLVKIAVDSNLVEEVYGLLADVNEAKEEQDSKYCDRNICIANEYNGISCDECEVTKSQKPQESEGQGMTKEEARKRLRGILTEAVEFENSVCYVTNEDREPLEMAIKALEQEPILDKIRAEIEQEYLAEGHLSDYWDGIDKCLQIVDKYKAESEDKE